MTQTRQPAQATFTEPGVDLEPSDLDDLFRHHEEQHGAVGQSVERKDARDKVLGRARYTDDLCPSNALWIKIKHSNIAHGYVKSIDISRALEIPGVVKVLTCFDVPDRPFPTAGHPWSTDPGHQDVADRLLLNRHVRFYGDDVAVVVAETELAAKAGVAALEVEYDTLPFVLDPVYGTRCTTLVLMGADGIVDVEERRYDARGATSGTSAERFLAGAGTARPGTTTP